MATHTHFQTDRQRVEGLGTAHEGVGPWWGQRVTSIALVPLTVFFVFPLARNLGSDWESVQLSYAKPFNAVVAVLFFIVTFRHLQYGIQVVVEDYIHDKPLKMALLLANIIFCWALALTGVYAVARIAFSV
jgi:succinate dehydrogenase / fumarate reductase, membrane anchor subunit